MFQQIHPEATIQCSDKLPKPQELQTGLIWVCFEPTGLEHLTGIVSTINSSEHDWMAIATPWFFLKLQTSSWLKCCGGTLRELFNHLMSVDFIQLNSGFKVWFILREIYGVTIHAPVEKRNYTLSWWRGRVECRVKRGFLFCYNVDFPLKNNTGITSPNSGA